MRKISKGIYILGLLLFFIFPGQARAENPLYYQGKIIVLMYHHLDPKPYGSSTISPDLFKEHLEMLKNSGFNVISMADLDDFYKHKKQIPANSLIITFDDGYESFYTYAYPELTSYGFTASNFIIVSKVGNKNQEIAKLDWEQMREMQSQGMSFFSHTYDSHYYAPVNALGRLAPVLAGPVYLAEQQRRETFTEYQERVLEDFTKSKMILEQELDRTVNCLAVPYGHYDNSLADLAKQAGYEYIFSIKSGINGQKTSLSRLLRINAGNPEISAELLKKKILSYADFKASTSSTKTDNSLKLVLNDKQLFFADQQPLLKDNRILVPLRFLSEQLNYQVSYHSTGSKQEIVIANKQRKIVMYLDQKEVYVDNTCHVLDAAPLLVNGRAMVPLRFISENMGLTIEWDKESNSIRMFAEELQP